MILIRSIFLHILYNSVENPILHASPCLVILFCLSCLPVACRIFLSVFSDSHLILSTASPASSSPGSSLSSPSLSPLPPSSTPFTGASRSFWSNRTQCQDENQIQFNSRVKEGNVAIYFSNGALLEEIAGPGVHWSTPFVTTVHQVPNNSFQITIHKYHIIIILKP